MAKSAKKSNTRGGGKKKATTKKTTKKDTGKAPYKKDAYEAFIDWVILTPDEKATHEIKSQKDFAEQYKVDEKTIVNWKKRDDFRSRKADAMRLRLADHTPDVMQALLKRIKKYGMGYEVELWLAYVEGWDKKTILEHKGNVEFGDDDIRALLAYLPKKERKTFYDTLTKLLTKAEHYRNQGKNPNDNDDQ